ncbi:hypothetical protein Acor_24310 [Acrocarpospora corrugata]|uniref:Calx-beta domain-containing protein n=1 Tax=Acrocarpospora corrugata TaxID=35763 RepID=A0A5M3VU88_9ACTN|nr:hypothetical protein Acor_24310 [Acrocarpospora corrugata]
MWGWGSNPQGQLGSLPGSVTNMTKVMQTGVTQIAAGANTSYFTHDNGQVLSVGHNPEGQLGAGIEVDRSSTPVAVVGLTRATRVSASSANQHNAFAFSSTQPLPPTFRLGFSPDSGVLLRNKTIKSQVVTSAVNGSTQSITLTATGLPSGVTASFNPPVVQAGGTSVMTLTRNTVIEPFDTLEITVTGTAGSTSRQSFYLLTLADPNPASGHAVPGPKNDAPFTRLLVRGNS